MSELKRTEPARVEAMRADSEAPRSGGTVSGYGGRIPTAYRLQYRGADGRVRWHRVRAMVYGNSAALYIVANGGQTLHLDTDTEHALEDIR